jgi:hypothetical protein
LQSLGVGRVDLEFDPKKLTATFDGSVGLFVKTAGVQDKDSGSVSRLGDHVDEDNVFGSKTAGELEAGPELMMGPAD